MRNESSPVNKGCKARAYRGGVSKQRRERQQPRQLHGRGARAQPPGAAADAAAFTGVGGVGGSGRWRDPQKRKKKAAAGCRRLLALGASVVCPTSERAARLRDHPSL